MFRKMNLLKMSASLQLEIERLESLTLVSSVQPRSLWHQRDNEDEAR
jgi:hypothetical protein